MRSMVLKARLPFWTTVVLVSTLLLSVSSASTDAAPLPGASRPPRPVEAPLDVRLPLRFGGRDERLGLWGPAVAEAADSYGWSSIAFQSLRDGNWEIYNATGDGQFPTRLTDEPAYDIHASLVRGCKHTAFASNRTGNYDIYVAAFGTAATQRLTDTAADDVNPAWSPDGTKVAFQSYRDGQAEIYVMEADGSLQTRLTFDDAYDGDPAWSPDGSHLAFVSARTGGYRIWVMQVDGSGQTPLSGQAYSENPTWSPDGTMIAYDADGDGDGWQELWLMDADGASQREVYDVGASQIDVWAGGWSPDGLSLAFTRIEFINYQGAWYWTSAYVHRYDVGSGTGSRLTHEGTDWNPDWQVCDLLPPVSEVSPLPSFSRNTFTIRWGGYDEGIAGIASYDVQYRSQDAVNWTDLKIGTEQTSANFVGTPGHTYSFRSRATDVAGNTEQWPPGDGDAQTVPYSWAIAGEVRDNTGIPVADAIVQTVPDAIASLGASSSYTLYAGGSSDVYTAMWSKPGYGDVPATAFSAQEDAWFDVVLPPEDNLLSNWGFETEGFGGWEASGPVAPTIVTTTLRTGNGAAMLGQVSFAHTAGEASSPRVVVDGASTLHVVWLDDTSGTNQVVYASRSSDGQWEWPQPIPNCPSYSVGPQIAVSVSGVVHVVWRDDRPAEGSLYHSLRGTDGQWTTPETIVYSAGFDPQHQVVVDGEVLHVVYQTESDLYHVERSVAGTWSSPQLVSAYDDWNWPSNSPAIAVDGSGLIHVVWKESYSFGFYVRHACRGATGTWSTPEEVSPFSEADVGGGPVLRVDSDGSTVHLLWMDGGPGASKGPYYRHREADGSWSAWERPTALAGFYTSHRLVQGADGAVHVLFGFNVSGDSWLYHSERIAPGIWTPLQDISDGHPGGAQVAVGDDGEIHVVWGGTIHPASSEIFYSRRTITGTWTVPQNLSNTPGSSGSARVVMDASGTLYVVWVDDTYGSKDIWYHVDPDPVVLPTGASDLSQSITIPITMTLPTLSFFYQLVNEWETDTNPLSVKVSDGITTATVFSTTEPTDGWTHRSVDLTAWRGQAVTLTFSQHNEYGAPCSSAFLDEVSLGSGYPDLWVSTALAPTQAPPGEQITQTIWYGNNGGGAAAHTRITATWPSELVAVGYSPQPAEIASGSVVWVLGDVGAKSGAHRIELTATVAATATLWQPLTVTVAAGSALPEIEVDNNTAEDSVMVLGPDLWVRKSATPLTALPGEQVTYDVIYGNSGEAASPGARITDWLPPEAVFVESHPPASISPQGLAWDVTLPGLSGPHRLVVTTTVVPTTALRTTITNTVTITSTASELDTGNNTSRVSVFIGHRLYMPVIVSRVGY